MPVISVQLHINDKRTFNMAQVMVRFDRSVFYQYGPYPSWRVRSIMDIGESSRNKPLWPRNAPPGPYHRKYSNYSTAQAWTSASGANLGTDAGNGWLADKVWRMPTSDVVYTQCYTKFADAARNGSSQWGMNAITWRKSLGTFVSLATTSAVAVTAALDSSKAAARYLAKNPSSSIDKIRIKRGRTVVRLREAKDRRTATRIRNEIWLLDQVTSVLLAIRYAVQPTVGDIYDTANILSRDATGEEASHRVARSSTGQLSVDAGWFAERGSVKRTCVLKCTTYVNNPNLHLATQLGLTNPQYWLWDAMPYSFIIDWWLKVGDFLNNFSATLGLGFKNASVTNTFSFYGELTKRAGQEEFRGTVFGSRKERVVGSLPFPTTIEYGTGLGVQRGQNALALVVQKLLRR